MTTWMKKCNNCRREFPEKKKGTCNCPFCGGRAVDIPRY